ncbi:cyclase [Marinitoga sp. 1135]|uniref:Putative metal-dependent hydrolase n=1 Tax=Marinitoga piezophila (strain DSM 14283 / JCM 11233 / KA3) TaxID=443254 RepID=H2J556_MARPK|nr:MULTISPECIES: cyclase family protein [Marinitoga]AEX86073.1 putative metal-dependent hydrolase [Marinitoga piezophila KA3]NUU96260.1 cyclase [Marinitoga sp. 1135]NUU98179.1 cyclase [Marinitoga sp. 1138]
MAGIKVYDLTQKIGITTPPWPGYEPMKLWYFKRMMLQKVNGQIVQTSMHNGTHLDGQRHFMTGGRDIASLPLDGYLFGEGVILDISKEVGDFDIYTPETLLKVAKENNLEIKKGDIIIINTGYHKYAWDQPEANENKYYYFHPGPDQRFADWLKEMEIKWVGVDCGSADHPMNTILREYRPEFAKMADEHFRKKYGKPLDEYFTDETYQLMHIDLFPHLILHAENLGGEIDKVLNRRMYIGIFPWKLVDGESSIARVAAFEIEG